MRHLTIAAITLCVLLAGCDPSRPVDDSNDDVPTQPTFNFETCKDVHVSLRVEDSQGNPVPRAPVSLLAERANAFTGGSTEGVILEGAPGNNGTVSAVLSVPITQDELIAQTAVSGTEQRQRISITGNRAEHTFVASSTSNASESPGLTLHQPADNFLSTLVFEDLWPTEGDLDVNDIVVDYNFEMPATTTGQITSMQATFITRATGSVFRNGFGFRMPLPPSFVSSVSGTRLTTDVTSTRSNGTEADTDRAVVIVYDDASSLFGQRFVNTQLQNRFVTPDTLQVTVGFTQPADTASLGTVPFNPFIIAQGERDREVHLPNHPPTSRANRELLDTGDDTSNPPAGRYYLSGENRPWGLNLCNGFIYPRESIRIENTYLFFQEWVDSGGQEFQDWYTNTSPEYREESNLYVKGLSR